MSRPSTTRNIELQNIFKAFPTEIGDLLSKSGRCFFIPAYQRDFDWSNPNISRFFEDICRGWSQLQNQDLAATFLGSIIAVLGSSRDDFPPEAQQNLPSAVGAVVDGQQRLSTLIMTCVALHDLLRKGNSVLARKKNKEQGEEWICDLTSLILGELRPMIEQEESAGDEPFRFYPRLIRRPEDQWGRRENNARYNSPIARLLNGYSAHSRDEDIRTYTPVLPDENSYGFEAHKAINSAYKHIRRSVQKIAKGENTPFDVPSLDTISNSLTMQVALAGAEIPEAALEQIDNAKKRESEGKHDNLARLLRLAMFARYLCRRVAVVLINAENEEYAFDIFECLNTTGEPLTAYQTFKPKVLAGVTSEEWNRSIDKKRLDIVEEYLREFSSPQARQKKTAEMVTTFALFESGEKLPYRLASQRQWMHQSYEMLADIEDEQSEFVWGLSTIASFMHHAWPKSATARSGIELEAPKLDQACLGLGVLRKAGHTIAIPLICRFYGKWRRSEPRERDAAAQEMVDVIKAISAFWVLWRLSRRDTGGIDDIYRTLMSDGFSRRKIKPEEEPLPLNVGDVMAALRKHLVDAGIGSRSDWITAVKRIPAYQTETAATKLALLAAMHNTVSDPANPGMLQVGRDSTYEALTFGEWASESTFTIEHVAPQTKSEGDGWDWPDDLYENLDTLDLLGNLVLCPKNTNSALGNETWAYKSAVYKVLATTRADEYEEAMVAAEGEGVAFGVSTKEFLRDHRHLRQMQTLGATGGPWGSQFVLNRTENIAGLVWQRLAPWLGLPAVDDSANGPDLRGEVQPVQQATNGESDEDVFWEEETEE